MGKLDNKVMIITGGARGMGGGTARKAAEYGAILNLFDLSENVYKVAESFRKQGIEATGYQVDVSDKEQVKAACDAVFEKYGRIDCLVNAAGIGHFMTIADEDADENKDKDFAVNFGGVWNTCRNVIPHMLEAGYGRIVNFGSVTGTLVADHGLLAYGATKGAIMGLTKELSLECAEYNVTVNAILPGTIKTPLLEGMAEEYSPDDHDAFYESIAKTIPMKRLGTEDEAGDVVCFLASDEASYITGVGLPFDGGNTVPEMNMTPVSSFREQE